MSSKNQLHPPKPPKSLEGNKVKSGFFSKLFLSLGLKHEHVQNFDALTHLHVDRPDPAIDEALAYEAAVKHEEEIKAAAEAEEKKREDALRLEEEKRYQKLSPIISHSTSFSEEVPLSFNSKKPGNISQDTEYHFLKTLDEEFSSNIKDKPAKKHATWLKTESESKLSMGDFSLASNELDNPDIKKSSSFTKDPEGYVA
jgi:hypothetical protein